MYVYTSIIQIYFSLGNKSIHGTEKVVPLPFNTLKFYVITRKNLHVVVTTLIKTNLATHLLLCICQDLLVKYGIADSQHHTEIVQ